VHASTEARFEEAYRGIADRLELPGRNDPQVNIYKLVSSWLGDEVNGRWTMVLDNVDNVEVFFPKKQDQRALRDHIVDTGGISTSEPQWINPHHISE
jgi:hypothetical protein